MPDPTPLQFPVIDLLAVDLQRWPRPSALLGRARWPADDCAQRCRIETAGGSSIEGELVAFDLDSATLQFRAHAQGAAVELSFTRIRSLTLTEPVLLTGTARPSGPVWRPDEPGDCTFSVEWTGAAQAVYSGVTAGISATRDGLFLFPSTDAFASITRSFIPQSAYRRFDVGPLDSPDVASSGIAPTGGTSTGISDLNALLQALDAQQSAPVLRIGESLIDLGLIDQPQLDQTLADKPADIPLGEALVAKGLISRADLLTGLAHKMGYPLVDLKLFPIDLRAAKLLPIALVKALRSLPIAIDAGRLIVAADRPGGLVKLRELAELAAYKVVIVIAPAARIADAIARLPHPDDPWALNVPLR